jgi:hypothetical protein
MIDAAIVGLGWWGKIYEENGRGVLSDNKSGEKIVKADVGRQLATLIHNLRRLPKRKTITVPVVRYAKEVA